MQRLADATGLSQADLSQIETGKRNGSVETLGAIASSLGVDIDDLLA
jgi:transcriptional regulator with XRE-family HTH domain